MGIEEGDGIPLQYACLENPMDGGAWLTAVRGVMKSRTQVTSLSRIGEGNGNPLQCSCLENAGDGGAWWAAIYGVTQSWTQLKLFISSSSKPWEYRKKILRFQKQSGQRSSIKSFHLCSSGSEASSQEIGLIAQGLRIKL